MQELGLKSISKRKKYKSYKVKVAKNIIKRDFKASKPNQKWTTDVTEFKINDKKLYLSPILDMFNGEIVSFELSTRPNMNMVYNMLDKAFDSVKDTNDIIFHSDQGFHYQHKLYQKRLKERGILQSMSRKGNCLDNSVMENFFGILKSEMFYTKNFESIKELKKEICEYIDYYNNKRIKAKLKGLSPVQYRTQSLITI